MVNSTIKIAFYCTKQHPKYKDSVEIAEDLQANLVENLPDEAIDDYQCILGWYSDQQDNHLLSVLDIGHKNPKHIYIDYISHIIANKSSYKLNYQDPLPKAMGLIKLKGENLTILDGTAGLTVDSFGIMQMHNNIKFTLIEQSPIVYQLIKDARSRLKNSNIAHLKALGNNMELANTDCMSYLETSIQNNKKFDIIYLDPMFEKPQYNAKPKKNMQFLQEFCSNPNSVEDLLKASLARVSNRVVLKRSKNHPKLFEKLINFSVITKQLRYDVYLASKVNNY